MGVGGAELTDEPSCRMLYANRENCRAMYSYNLLKVDFLQYSLPKACIEISFAETW